MRLATCLSNPAAPTCSSNWSMPATRKAPPCSPPIAASETGALSSAITSWPRPCWTACCTMPSSSRSRAIPTGCGNTPTWSRIPLRDTPHKPRRNPNANPAGHANVQPQGWINARLILSTGGEFSTGTFGEFSTGIDKAQRLMTIPGVGALTATALLAALGEVTAFRNGRELGNFQPVLTCATNAFSQCCSWACKWSRIPASSLLGRL